jgi:endonuclease/exonuclease/phosphatase family metal-dependent hydrolase
VRVATFNIQHGHPAAGGAVDPDAVAKAVALLHADVLAIQEVDRGVGRSGGHDLAVIAAEACGAELAWGESVSALDGGSYGVALLVRGAIADVQTLQLPRPRRSRREPRVALLATATVGGTSLTVAATHLGVPLRENGPQLAAVLDALDQRTRGAGSGEARRWLLLGDLNRIPPLVRPMVEEHGGELADGSPTFPNRLPVARIDHIAARGAMLSDVEVVATEISDHRALTASLVRPV